MPSLRGIGLFKRAAHLPNVLRAPAQLTQPAWPLWDEHFELHGAVIQPLTEIGEATARMLRLNGAERVVERRLVQVLGQYRNG